MRVDWRRQILDLPSIGDISVAAVRAAYWRLASARPTPDKERLREARRQLLFELGARVPAARKTHSAAVEEA